jgi:hypothetical protein
VIPTVSERDARASQGGVGLRQAVHSMVEASIGGFTPAGNPIISLEKLSQSGHRLRLKMRFWINAFGT